MTFPRTAVSFVVVLTSVLAVTTAGAGARPASAQGSAVVLVGASVRFQVLSPTLIRLEQSADGTFEDRPSETALNRAFPVPRFTTSDALGITTIDTGAVSLRYVDNSGPFTAANLSVRLLVAGVPTTVAPTWDSTGCQAAPSVCQATGGAAQAAPLDPTALGYYTREVVSVNTADAGPLVAKRSNGVVPASTARAAGPGADVRLPMHAGFLHTTGWSLLDDSGTALRTSSSTAVARSTVPGYQDGYFFGYGHDYLGGLKDFNDLTGHTVLLPRWTFGPWFSLYADLKDTDYRALVAGFRSHGTPLDGLVLDTDFKADDTWNGWEWNSRDFPAPDAFVDWANAQHLHLTLNIHPSIDENDPKYAAAQATSKGTLTASPLGCEFYRQGAPPCDVFDWGNPDQAKAYFDLHDQFTHTGTQHQGVDTLWLDWCCDASTVSTPGLTPDSWINDLYANDERRRGHRGYVVAEVGSGIYAQNPETGDLTTPGSPWAAHRDTVHVTGDASSDWDTLATEGKLLPAEGEAIDEAYLTNDIGGYNGVHLADDLYDRWVQMGAFSSIDRLHSKNGDRLPWQYLPDTAAAAERFLRLREALVPYTYDTAEQAHQTGAPVTRALQLLYPEDPAAAAATDEWMLGDSLLVAPITTPGTTASRSVYLPAGRWTDFFTGEVSTGPVTLTTPAEGFDRMPVYLKAGGIVPLAPARSNVDQADDPLTLRVGSGADGSSLLYSDSGDGLGYERGQSTQTPLQYTEFPASGGQLTIGATTGSYPGAPTTHGYDVQFLATDRPQTVTVDGVAVPAGPEQPGGADPTVTRASPAARDQWSYDPVRRILTVALTGRPTSVAHRVTQTTGRAVAHRVAPQRPTAPFTAAIAPAEPGLVARRRFAGAASPHR